mmetsp:Transcript_20890/g.57073  ORF Transcript_20890/g.57073 Transcript_20890/m.57073 type:complete len:552 (-) Transcript_20890:20-1675(-)
MVVARLPPGGRVAVLLEPARHAASAVTLHVERHLHLPKRGTGSHAWVRTAVDADANALGVLDVLVALLRGLRRVADVEGQRGRGFVQGEGLVRAKALGILADKHVQAIGVAGRQPRCVQHGAKTDGEVLLGAAPEARDQRVCGLKRPAHSVGHDLLRDGPDRRELVVECVRCLHAQRDHGAPLHREAHPGQAPLAHDDARDAGRGVLAPRARPALLHDCHGLRLTPWTRNAHVLGHGGPLVEHAIPRARLLPLPAPHEGEGADTQRVRLTRVASSEVAGDLLRGALLDVGVPDRHRRLPVAGGAELRDRVGLGPAGGLQGPADAQGGIAVSVDPQEVDRRHEPNNHLDLVRVRARQDDANGMVWVLGLYPGSHPIDTFPDALRPKHNVDLHLDLVADGPPKNRRGALVAADLLQVRGHLLLPERIAVHVRAVLVEPLRVRHPDARRKPQAVGLCLRDGAWQVCDVPRPPGVHSVGLCVHESFPTSSSADRSLVSNGAGLGHHLEAASGRPVNPEPLTQGGGKTQEDAACQLLSRHGRCWREACRSLARSLP